MSSDDIHKISELEQVNLILKKLAKISEYKNVDRQSEQSSNDMSHRIAELEQVNLISKKLGVLLQNKTGSKISAELLTKLHHELRTPMVPIRSYTDMLLAGHFGKLSEQQIKKMEVVNSNVKRLEETVVDLLDLKKFSSDNNMTENNSSPHESLTKTEEIPKENEKPKKQLNKTIHQVKELEQEKLLLKKSLNLESQKNQILSKKYYLIIAIAGIAIAGIFVPYSLYVVTLVGEEYRVQDPGLVKSGYVIQDLKGDTIDTWLSWRLVEGESLHINVLNSKKYQDRIDVIKQVILSEESIEIDNSFLHKGPSGTTSTHYIGWRGALLDASQSPTEFYIPINLEIIESSGAEGDITIELTNLKSGDGYSGFTKSIADQSQNQILKSHITIYEIDKLSDNQLTTILRHEMGHALGLAHSTAPEDLMAPTITTEFPYISECDVDAIVKLYDDGKSSQVVCEI